MVINIRNHQRHVVIQESTSADILSTILGDLVTAVSITQAKRNHTPSPKYIKSISATLVDLPIYS